MKRVDLLCGADADIDQACARGPAHARRDGPLHRRRACLAEEPSRFAAPFPQAALASLEAAAQSLGVVLRLVADAEEPLAAAGEDVAELAHTLQWVQSVG